MGNVMVATVVTVAKVEQAPMPAASASASAGADRARSASLVSTLGGSESAMQTAATVSIAMPRAQPQQTPPLSRIDIMKLISTLAIFMALSYTFSFTLVAIGAMAGRIEDGKDNVGAAALITTYLNMVIMIALAGFYCVSAYISEKWGKLKTLEDSPIPSDAGEAFARAASIKDVIADISRVFKNSAILGITPSAFAILLLIFSENILKWLKQPDEVSELAGSFLSVYSLAVIPLLIRMCLEQILFAFKQQKAAMVIGLLSFVIGVGFAYSLCFNAGFGLRGIAAGFVIEAVLTCIGFAAYLARHKIFKGFNFFSDFSFGKEDTQQMGTLVRGGWPIALTIGLEVIAMQVMTSMAGKMGADELAAFGIAFRFYITMLIPTIAFGQTTRQEVSRWFGQEHFLNMTRVAKYGLLSTVALILPFCITIAAYPELLIKIMTGGDVNQEVRDMVKVLAPIIAIGVVLPDTIRYSWLQVLSAIAFFEKNTKGQVLPVIFSTGSLWAGVITAWLLSNFMDLGIYGVAGSLTAGVILGAALLGPQWLAKINSYENRAAPVPIFMSRSLNDDPNADPNEVTPLLGAPAIPLAAPASTGMAPPVQGYNPAHYPSSV